MEYKSIPTAIKSIDGRAVVGIFAVHGNIDSYGDISHPGSFAKTIAERGARVKYLWNHDMLGSVPTAAIKGLREITRDELPSSVIQAAPDATGGVEVTREYLDTPKGNEILHAIKAGAIDEMSYGYDPLTFSFSEIDQKQVRNLHEVKLWEVSDVIFGANPATVGSKLYMPLSMLLLQLEAHMDMTNKAGARHSSSDMKALNSIHTAVVALGADECKGVMSSSEEGKSAQDTDKQADPELEGRSRADRLTLDVARQRLHLLDFLTG